MTVFFQRSAQVILERTTPLLPIQIGGPGKQLHVQFTCTKSNLGQPNTLELSIFGLAESTRKALQGKGSYVFLRAGYKSDEDNLPVVFQGGIRTIDHVRQGPEWVTKIACGDGELPYRFGMANKSFKAGTGLDEVLKYLAGQVKGVDSTHLDVSPFLAKLSGIAPPVRQFASGFATQGNAFEEMQRLLGDDFELSIQDGQLQALKPTETRRTVPLLDDAHGLLGSPEHGSPTQTGLTRAVLKVKSLLRPDIGPGDLLSVQTKGQNNSGTYRVQKIVHTGDLTSDAWHSEMECIAVQA